MTKRLYTTIHADPDGAAAAYLAAVEMIDDAIWSTFAAGYRQARTAYGVAEALLSEAHALDLHDHHHRDLQADLVCFEVTSFSDLVEKAQLIALDVYDGDCVAAALLADLARLGGCANRQATP